MTNGSRWCYLSLYDSVVNAWTPRTIRVSKDYCHWNSASASSAANPNTLSTLLAGKVILYVILSTNGKCIVLFVSTDDYLIHLDPHHCQEMVDVLIPNFPLKSFHCRELRKTALKQVDPSCCVGFYLRSQRDFDEFRRNVQHYLVPPQSKGDYPIFAFSSGSSPHVDDTWFHQDDDNLPPMMSSGGNPSADNHLDDFEFLWISTWFLKSLYNDFSSITFLVTAYISN